MKAASRVGFWAVIPRARLSSSYRIKGLVGIARSFFSASPSSVYTDDDEGGGGQQTARSSSHFYYLRL